MSAPYLHSKSTHCDIKQEYIRVRLSLLCICVLYSRNGGTKLKMLSALSKVCIIHCM